MLAKQVFQITDVHIKNEEPFFRAGVALDNYLIEFLKKQTLPFTLLDSGDHFHTSKETGRVNNEVARFFLEIASLSQCERIYIMQGNHDIKEDTGSALDLLRDLDSKIVIVDKLLFVDGLYLLPYMKPYSIPDFMSMKSYGEEEFHKAYWQSQGVDWEHDIKPNIKMVSMHGGDELTGKLFMNADISFLPSLRSNGHIHKNVASSCLTSTIITRRDEANKECVIRQINIDNERGWLFKDTAIPLFLNYARIKYGDDIESFFKEKEHLRPLESLIVDIYGHDDADEVIKEYTQKWKDNINPRVYIGDVAPVERQVVTIETSDDNAIRSIDIKGLLTDFCTEKGIVPSVTNDLLKRVVNYV